MAVDAMQVEAWITLRVDRPDVVHGTFVVRRHRHQCMREERSEPSENHVVQVSDLHAADRTKQRPLLL
jgi:hypothetical protein